MDPGAGPSDPFKRSGKVRRSPTQRAMSLPDIEADIEAFEVAALPTQTQGQKRKETTPPSAVAKKRQTGDDPPASDDESEEEVAVMPGRIEDSDYRGKCLKIKSISSDLIRWSNSQYKSRKLTNPQVLEIKSKLADITEVLESIQLEASYMAGRIAERSDIKQKIEEAMTGAMKDVPMGAPAGRPTFAEIARGPRVPRITGVSSVTAPKVIFVRSEGDQQDVDQVKEIIKKSIRPSKLGINIKRVVKTARGVMVEAESQDQLEKLKTCPELGNKGLVFDKPKKRKPRIMIYDVDPPEDENEMLEDIFEQNMTDSDIDMESFKKEFTVVHKYGRRDPKDKRVALVVECSARVRNEVRKRDRIYVGWQSCRLKDYNPVVRCYKCQQFGHVAKYCRNKDVCPLCAEAHKEADCRNKNKAPKCANCLTAKRASNHSLTDPKCPEFIRATKIAYERIDYES